MKPLYHRIAGNNLDRLSALNDGVTGDTGDI